MLEDKNEKCGGKKTHRVSLSKLGTRWNEYCDKGKEETLIGWGRCMEELYVLHPFAF